MLEKTRRIRALAALLVVFLLFISPHAVRSAEAAADVITAEQAHKELTGENPPLLLDVRTKAEFESRRLKTARRIIVDDFVSGEYEKKLGKIAKDAPVIVYCRTGRRSGIARDVLVKDGYSNIRNLEGGILAWGEAGLPIVKGTEKKQGRESSEQAGGR